MKNKINILFVMVFVMLFLSACQSQNNYNVNKEQEKEQQKITQKNTVNQLTLLSAITEEEFKKYLEKDAVIIDIRTPEEIGQGKINKDALEINFYDKYFQQEILKLDNAKTYFIYCAHGNRTRKAKEIMQSIGFNNVYDLRGGIVTWKSELVK